MSRRKCRDWIKSYLEYTDNMESPEVFHFWTAVATIGGSLRKRVFINQRKFQWIPNFFIIFVGPPGIVKKTTTLDVGKSFLSQLEYIHIAADVTTWEAFLQRFAQARDDIQEATGANWVDSPQKPACSMTIMAGELGTFLDPTNKAMVNNLTDLWDGKKDGFRKETKTQGDDVIPDPFLNMIGCTTPAWMHDNFKGKFVGWGFSSRTILIYRDRRRKRVAYPGLENGVDHEEVLKDNLAHDLKEISNLCGEYKLTPDAIELGRSNYEAHCDREDTLLDSGSLDEYLQHFLARKQGHIHKLALVLAASRRNDLIITRDDLEEAIKRVDELEQEMHKLFIRSARIPEDGTANHILRSLEKNGRMKETLVYREMLNFNGKTRDVSDAITMLLKSDMVERISEAGAIYLEVKAEPHAEP